MGQLGISDICARCPQLMSRVERIAGTALYRLVTDLRLVAASTISQTTELLHWSCRLTTCDPSYLTRHPLELVRLPIGSRPRGLCSGSSLPHCRTYDHNV